MGHEAATIMSNPFQWEKEAPICTISINNCCRTFTRASCNIFPFPPQITFVVVSPEDTNLALGSAEKDQKRKLKEKTDSKYNFAFV